MTEEESKEADEILKSFKLKIPYEAKSKQIKKKQEVKVAFNHSMFFSLVSFHNQIMK